VVNVKGLLVTIGLSTVAVLAVACGNGEAATAPATEASSGGAQPSAPGNPASESVPPIGAPETSAVGVQPAVSPVLPGALPPARSETSAQPPVAAPQPAAVGSVAVPNVAGMPVSGGTYQLQSSSGQAGIWVSGQGKITLEPDLAVLNLGVETSAKTVADARQQAATAMDAIVASLTASGVEAKDIQTRFFNISPQYEWTEVIQNGVRTNKQVLVGYRVSNSAAVKIRDLSAVGTIIDDVAGAGGDATRINGISFTVENTAPLMADLREEAVGDALAKAAQFARLTGVSLGRLMFISETGGGRPQARGFEEFGAARSLSAAAPDTRISGGELEISLSVQAVFAIQ